MIKRNLRWWLHTKWEIFIKKIAVWGYLVRSSRNHQDQLGVSKDQRCTNTASPLHIGRPRTRISCVVHHMSHSVMHMSCLKGLNNLNGIKLIGCHTWSLCSLLRVSRGSVWFERRDIWHVECPYKTNQYDVHGIIILWLACEVNVIVELYVSCAQNGF